MSLHRRVSTTLYIALGIALLPAGRTDAQPFIAESIPLSSYKIFDMGIVDANGDGHLDVFTTNCQARANLLLGSEAGRYQDVSGAWGFQHTRAFPGFAMAAERPVMDKPGLYCFLLFRTLHLRAVNLPDALRISGTIKVMTHASISSDGSINATVTPEKSPDGEPMSVVDFSFDNDGEIMIVPEQIMGPMTITFDSEESLAHIFIGSDLVQPSAKQVTFDFYDPHGVAWADIIGDSRMDAFVCTGALQALPELSPTIGRLHDRVLQQRDGGLAHTDILQGLAKNACAARGAAWVDYDVDGDLDLFVTCAREQRSLLFRRVAADRFENVAEQCGLGPGEEAYLWLDVDDDLDPDLLTTHSNAIWLYLNEDRGTRFRAVEVTRESAPEKFTFSDFDHDGDPDVFAAAREPSSLLLINDGNGGFSVRATEQTGLPPRALTAQWVDYDNDGRDELYILPGGLFRPDDSGRFARLRLADNKLPEDHTAKGLASWFDADNDGDLDLLSAVRLREERWQVILHRNQLSGSNWLELDLAGLPGNRQAIGARVTLEGEGHRITRWVGQADGALSSQGHYRMYFGLGAHKPRMLSVRWPDGTTQSIDLKPVNMHLQISQQSI